MVRLPPPLIEIEDTIDECIKGIKRNTGLSGRLKKGKDELIVCSNNYKTAALQGKLFAFKLNTGNLLNNSIILGSLTKADLLKAYEDYLVPTNKPARRIYDILLNASNKRCPYCGGIGESRNLDHYLPKTKFPQFSILPCNLIPACRDCNMDGKGDSFAINEETQIIQPYFDKNIFFDDQWIYAIYQNGGELVPGNFEYYVDTPEQWDPIDKSRALEHFERFNLARRYSIKAGEALGTTLAQIKKSNCVGLSNEKIKFVILQPAIDNALFVNHWQVGMNQALMQALPEILA